MGSVGLSASQPSSKPSIRRVQVLAAHTDAMAVVPDRIAGALWGAFIADAMAMPTHWFYGGESQVRSEFGGPIKGYTKSRPQMRGSIMNLSNTGGAGRGSDKGSIIGDVINHGKKQYWTKGGEYHYHHTLEAGENTLEAQLMRVMMRSISGNSGTFNKDRFVDDYVTFMTTPGSHNDTYASTAHRMFFSNREAGRPLSECPDNDHHNVDTIDAFDIPIVVALATATAPDPAAVKQSALATRGLSRQVLKHCELLSSVIHQLVTGSTPAKETLQQAGLKLGVDIAGAARQGM